MNTTEQIQTPETTKPTPHQERMEAWQTRRQKALYNLEFCNNWIQAHAAELEKANHDWSCYGIRRSIEFSFHCWPSKPREVAAAFGQDGWIRKKDDYSCGRINWFKTVDGMEIKLKGAENLSMNIREEVRL